MELIALIDKTYSTTSDGERRRTMQTLSQYFATPESWAPLLSLFEIFLHHGPSDPNSQKRQRRVCFFASNALLNKIKRDDGLTCDQRLELSTRILQLIFTQQGNDIHVCDPKGLRIGHATIKRLILCVSTLMTSLESLHQYVSFAQRIISSHDSEVGNLGLEMLLALASSSLDDNNDEDQNLSTRSVHKLEDLQAVGIQLFQTMDEKVQSGPHSFDVVLFLETFHNWLKICPSQALHFPRLLEFGMISMSSTDNTNILQTASSLLQSLAELGITSSSLRDSLLQAMVLAKSRFQLVARSEENQQAIAGAFSKIAECDAERIFTLQTCHGGDMIEFAFLILASPHRNVVAKTVMDFFLSWFDVCPSQRPPINFEERLLHACVTSCQFHEKCDQEDVELYRMSSDGPRDLFVALFDLFQDDFVVRLGIMVKQGANGFLSEASLFGLRSASKEICQNQDLSPFMTELLDPRMLAGCHVAYLACFCGAVGDFSSLIPPTSAAQLSDFLLSLLSQPQVECPHACFALLRLSVHHSAILRQISQDSQAFLLGSLVSKIPGKELLALGEYFARISNSPRMLLHHVCMEMDCSLVVRVKIVTRMLPHLQVGDTIDTFLIPLFTRMSVQDEELTESLCQLLTQCSHVKDCKHLVRPILFNWIRNPSLRFSFVAHLFAASIEREDDLTNAECAQLIAALFEFNQEDDDAKLQGLHHALVYFSVALFVDYVIPPEAVLDFVLEKYSTHPLARRVLLDMITRTAHSPFAFQLQEMLRSKSMQLLVASASRKEDQDQLLQALSLLQVSL